MPTVWWDDASQYRIDPGSGTQGGSVPEEIPRSRWSDWDKAAIGGAEIPGHVVVFCKKEKKADTLSVAGQDGATINHLGVEPVEMDITITIWTPFQFAAYERLVGMITPKAFPPPPTQTQGTAPTKPTAASSFEIRHPPLNMLGVTAVYIYEIGSLMPGPVFGAKVAVWRAKERKPTDQIQIQAANGLYSIELRPAQTPAPTQPVAKPSLTAVGP
jgi:hypothetical protein